MIYLQTETNHLDRAHWLGGWLVGLLSGGWLLAAWQGFASWLACWMGRCLAGLPAGWLVCWLAGLLACLRFEKKQVFLKAWLIQLRKNMKLMWNSCDKKCENHLKNIWDKLADHVQVPSHIVFTFISYYSHWFSYLGTQDRGLGPAISNIWK